METMIKKTAKQLIEAPQQLRPHVVLLGAGASRAAFPRGDRATRQVPLMNDLVDIIGLKQEIEDTGESFESGHNFESIYSRLYSGSEPKHERARRNIEKKIEEYFSALHLPDQATIYDHMLLSLRQVDAVFTFNWDPFLFDAYERNRGIVPLPGIFFLHGNVRIGQCPTHNKKWGRKQNLCPDCEKPLEPVPLLYPVEKKGYSKDPYIRQSWEAAEQLFEDALVITIFGYSAPDSDQDAFALLKSAWMNRSSRKSEHVEVIDIDEESILYERWKPFTPTLHFHRQQDFKDSWIALYPRRSSEAVWFPMSEGMPCDDFPMEFNHDLKVLQKQATDIAYYETSLRHEEG